jgi:Phage integrase family.
MLKNATGQDRTYAAIGMFAGVRPEEICRVSWAMVDLDHSRIRIPGSITKTRIGRTIDLEPNAVGSVDPWSSVQMTILSVKTMVGFETQAPSPNF